MIGQILLEAGQAAAVCFVVMLFLAVMYSPGPGPESDVEEKEEDQPAEPETEETEDSVNENVA